MFEKAFYIIHACLPLRDYHFVCVLPGGGARGGGESAFSVERQAKEAQQKLKTPRAFVWRLLVFVGCLLPLALRRSICHEIILYGYARNLQS
jgi:hypothetical protein